MILKKKKIALIKDNNDHCLFAIIMLIKRRERAPNRFRRAPFNRCAGTRKRGPAPINPQIMIAVRLRPWDLRLATGPITYPPPYRRICVAGRARTYSPIMYTRRTSRPAWNESMDLWNWRENGRTDRRLLSNFSTLPQWISN